MRVCQGLPADLPAAVFVVLHIPPNAASMLPQLLARAGRLPATHAEDGAEIVPGHIYVAPPDQHLLLRRGFVRVTRGPRENRNRPALDPLFRTAAIAYGPRVVGVVLTGTLDDGTAGLFAIKRRGGIAVAQDPEDALFDGMPRSALANVPVDYCLPLVEIPAALTRLAHEPVVHVQDGDQPMPDKLLYGAEMAELDRAALEDDQRPGDPSPFSCPDCGGVLWETHDGRLTSYRCRVGHAFSAETLLASQAETYEAALWSALRALEEKASLARRMTTRARQNGLQAAAERFSSQLSDIERHVETLRRMLLSGDDSRIAAAQEAQAQTAESHD